MRKLAREAVIFMLLTPVVVFVGSFIYLYHDAHNPQSLLQPGETLGAPNSSLPPVTAEALKTFQPLPPPDPSASSADARNGNSPVYLDNNGNPIGNTPAPTQAVPKAAAPPVTLDMSKAIPIPAGATIGAPVPTPTPTPFEAHAPPAPILDLLGDSLLFGLYGFPVGFGFWAFYRVVRFAIKG